MIARARARVEGVVQGVGFRPFALRLARELSLDGFVLNDERGVLVEVQGPPGQVERFLARLREDAPPLAVVERVRAETIPAVEGAGFRILESPRGRAPDAPVSPDVAICEDCLRELFDPADRRFRYPFLNCTNCGPRFTIVRGVPYDRPRTTMAGFAMCAACRAEYEDPADRRFHAQPIACPDCGPRLSSPLEEIVVALRGGKVVAIKGLGGYHLACVASDERAVAALRSRKHREDKPFALMVPGVEAARALVELGAAEEALLRSRERPIVLVPRRDGAPVAAAVAPRSRELGVMLPYTPLHHLLLADMGVPLVMTSGNVSDEPIAYEDAERLRGIADLIVSHDRPIHMRTDDSVVRQGLMLRRSRGFVPASLPLRVPRPVLACGAELKNTFCLARGERAWVSHHIGDLANAETLRAFTTGIEHFQRLFGIEPEVVAHDLHPEYLSTKYALDRDAEHVGVQHHHAHLAACLAEHAHDGPVVGAIFDGTGYGPDGTVWGGEILAGGIAAFERAAHLWPVRMPGGEQAVRQPWRMACAWLQEATGEEPAPLPGIDEARWRAVASLARTDLAPVTSSMGRLFDAVAALLGIRLETTYEGQAAIELEAAAAPGEHGRYELGAELDPRPMIRAIARDRHDPAVVAARFHDTIAHATAQAVLARDMQTAVLSGGVFLNRRLLETTRRLLTDAGMHVLVPRRLPPGDGGISYGQAAVAAAQR